MRIRILPHADAVAESVARTIAAQIQTNPSTKLGLATGGSPVGVYRRLIELCRSGELSFQQVRSFNLDEYLGLGPEHPASYRFFMDRELFEHIDIDRANTFVPNGISSDPWAECDRYESLVRDAGGVDFQLLGIGSDGHIAFNEPGSSFGVRTRVVALTDRTRSDNARFFQSIDEVPELAISMGIGTILEARQICLIAFGDGKAKAIADAIEGPLTASVPASSLQLHSDVTFVIDEAAASQLQRKTFYIHQENLLRNLGNQVRS